MNIWTYQKCKKILRKKNNSTFFCDLLALDTEPYVVGIQIEKHKKPNNIKD